MGDNRSTVPVGRAQTNVDFVVALLILLTFLTGTLFTAGSPLLGGDRSQIDHRLDAQRILVEITGELTDDDGQLNEAETRAMITSGNLDPYLSTGPDVSGNLTLRPAINWTSSRNTVPSLFEPSPERTVGEPVPKTATSTASTTVLLDNRGTRMELILWVDQ